MVKKYKVTDRMCPHCGKIVKVKVKVFGESSPQCPVCGNAVLDWLISPARFNVAGGTNAQRETRKYKEKRND